MLTFGWTRNPRNIFNGRTIQYFFFRKSRKVRAKFDFDKQDGLIENISTKIKRRFANL